MGLTIHWALGSASSRAGQARRLVEQLRQRALELPFEKVGEVLELRGIDCQPAQLPQNDPRRWLLIQASQTIERTVNGTPRQFQVAPSHLFAFTTNPGPGCEPANFGLCRYPSHLEIEEERQFFVRQGFVRPRRRFQTNLTGWSWSSFSKTQYASNRNLGGVENFLRCHLSILRLLDAAQELGLLTEVVDEGGFWERRDVKALVHAVGEWNELVAGMVGKLKDKLGMKVEAEITKFPDFEHLEAKGRPEE